MTAIYVETSQETERSLGLDPTGEVVEFGKGNQVLALTLQDAAFLARGLNALLGGVPPLVQIETQASVSNAKPKAESKRPSRAGKPWTDEEDARMIELLKTHGGNIKQIADELDRTPSAISSRLLTKGLVTFTVNKDALEVID